MLLPPVSLTPPPPTHTLFVMSIRFGKTNIFVIFSEVVERRRGRVMCLCTPVKRQG